MEAPGTAVSRPKGRAWALIGAALVCWGAAVSLGVWRDRQHALPPVADDVLYLRGGAALPRLALEFDAILADIYWIRAIQHFGGTRRAASDGDKSYRLLYPLLDITTTLDPHFNIAYRFGSIFLSEPYPSGPGRTDQAIALLERGLAADPTKWQYAEDAGFVHYWWRQDYKAAAEWFDRGARMEGAPWWLRSMAATTLAEGGDRQSSRQLWRQLYESADNDWVKNNAQLRLAQIDALDQMDALATLVRRYVDANGGPPGSWRALAPYGLRAVPVDPSGTPFELDASAPGGVALSPRSPLSPLPPSLTGKAANRGRTP
jgi:tetratricopeptide (TPR) repeat protein